MSFLIVSVVALIIGFVGSLPLAGPIALLVVSNGVNGKYNDALLTALGAAVAEGAYAFLAFWGFATFLARYPLVVPISHGVTAALLLALGVRFLFFRAKTSNEADSAKRAASFWTGLSISAVNPTLLVTWGAVTTFLYARHLVRFQAFLALPFGIFAGVGVALWGVGAVALLKRSRNKVPTTVLTWVVRAIGIAMIGVGLWSTFSLARMLEKKASLASRSEVRLAGLRDARSRPGLLHPPLQ
jgi:threonine/homoserine/homoserine lactone efflux protein